MVMLQLLGRDTLGLRVVLESGASASTIYAHRAEA